MAKDVLEVLEEYIAEEDPRRWAKLSSTVESRRLELLVLKEILVELRAMNKTLSHLANRQ